MATGANLFADPEREARLIAALVVEPGLIRAIEDELAPDAISTPELRAGYRALLRGEPVSASITTAAPSAHPLEDARVLANMHAAGATYALLMQAPGIVDGIRNGSRGADDLERLLSEALAAGRATRTALQPLTPSGALIGDVLADLDERARRLKETGSAIIGLCTGFATLDERIGGLEPSTVTLLAAKPNIGKTTLANQWAYAIARSSPVLYVSFENPPADLIRKQLTRLASVNATDALRGRADHAKLATAAETYAAQAGARLYYVSATASTDVGTIQGLAERVQRAHRSPAGELPPVLVIVDYLQKLALLERAGRGDDMRHRVARVVQELRDLAEAISSPVLAITTVNRAAYANGNDRPGMANLKESGDLEYAADVVLLLSDEPEEPEGKGKRTSEPAAPGFKAIWLDVAKNRYGKTGALPLLFASGAGRFEERTTGGLGGR